MATQAELQALQDLVNNVLVDGVTNAEAQRVLESANNIGVTPQRLALLSGLPETEVRAAIDQFSPNNPLLNYDVGFTNPITTPSAPAANTATTAATTPAATAPAANAPDISFTGDQVLTAQAMGQNLFNNNPGALGFNDLNPIITGSDNVTQTAIPEFLKPILADAANVQQGALQSYLTLLSQDNALLSPFNQNQNAALAMQADLARNDPNNFLGTTQNVLQEAALGEEVNPLFNRGRTLLESQDILGDLRNMGRSNPLEIVRGEMDSLAGIARGDNNISGVGRSALERTAQGDFLYGGEGFNAALDAATRAAMPGINSRFALGGGSGAVDGGLAQTARTQAVADAFARQYGQERANQLAAGNQLLSDQNRRTSQQIAAGGQLGTLALGNTAQMQNALNTALRGSQNAGTALANAANQERARQLNAALRLPQVGLLNSQILGSVGDRQQAQETARRQANAQAMQNLLTGSFGAINPNSLFGNIQSVTTNQNRGLSGLGGALAGAQLGTMVPGLGPGVGALAGGLLGAFG
jgi:hypothetical protein|tara:strand:+ start:3630 stop:5216 length:1587 start_codon:yes stop_codon:yes gene_type:complete